MSPYSIMQHRKGETSLQVCLGCVSFKYSPCFRQEKVIKLFTEGKLGGWRRWQQPEGEQRRWASPLTPGMLLRAVQVEESPQRLCQDGEDVPPVGCLSAKGHMGMYEMGS